MIHNKFEIIKNHFSNSLPYNWRSPFAYSITVLIQTIVIVCSSLIWICVLITYIGFCRFIINFTDDIKINLDELNSAFVHGHEINQRERIKLKIELFEIIQFHSDAHQ